MVRNIAWAIFCAVALATGNAKAAENFISFDVPGSTFTSALGINNDGAVVGRFVDSAGKSHGYLLKDGNFTTIDYPGAVWTNTLGINSQGDIVGCHIDDPTRIANVVGCHGFLLKQGAFIPLDYPGKYGAIASGINDAGQIVGCNHDDDGPGGVLMDDMHGFLFGNGSFSQLSQPNSMNNAVSADGNITAGLMTTNGITRGYLAKNDVVIPFDFPFSIATEVWGMSASGDELVGDYTDTAKKIHGFLLRFGDSIATFGINPQLGMTFEFISIDYPGATSTLAHALNSGGDVVGNYADSGGKTHAFFVNVRRRNPD